MLREQNQNTPPQVVKMSRSTSQNRSSSLHVRRNMPENNLKLCGSGSRSSLRHSTSDLQRVTPHDMGRRASRAETIGDIYDDKDVDWNEPEAVRMSESDGDNSESMSSLREMNMSLRRTVSRTELGRSACERFRNDGRKWSDENDPRGGRNERVCGLLSRLNDTYDIDDTSDSEDAGEGYASSRTPDEVTTPPRGSPYHPGTPQKEVRVLSSDVNSWSVEDVAAWASHANHLGGVVENFVRRHAVSGPVLLTLDEEVLTELGMDTFGHRRQLMLSIKKLQSDQAQREARPSQTRDRANPLISDRTTSHVGSSTVVSSNADYSGLDSSRMDSSRIDRGRSDVSTTDTRSKRLDRVVFADGKPHDDHVRLHSGANVSPRTNSRFGMHSPVKPGPQRPSPRRPMNNGAASARSNLSNFTSVSSRVANVDTPIQEQRVNAPPPPTTEYRTSPRYSTGITAADSRAPKFYQAVPPSLDFRTSPRFSAPAGIDYRISPRFSGIGLQPPVEHRTLRRSTTTHQAENMMRNSVEGMAEGIRSLSQQMNNMAEHMKSMSQLPPNDSARVSVAPSHGITGSTVPGSLRASFATLPQPPLPSMPNLAALPSVNGRPNAQPVPNHFTRNTQSPLRLGFERPGATSPLSFQRTNSVISLAAPGISPKAWQHGGH